MPARIQPAFRLKIATYKEALLFSLKAEVPHNGKAVPLHARWAQRGDRGTATPIPDPDAGRWSTPHPTPLYIQKRNPVPIVQEAGCASGTVWTGEENLVPSVFFFWGWG